MSYRGGPDLAHGVAGVLVAVLHREHVGPPVQREDSKWSHVVRLLAVAVGQADDAVEPAPGVPLTRNPGLESGDGTADTTRGGDCVVALSLDEVDRSSIDRALAAVETGELDRGLLRRRDLGGRFALVEGRANELQEGPRLAGIAGDVAHRNGRRVAAESDPRGPAGFALLAHRLPVGTQTPVVRAVDLDRTAPETCRVSDRPADAAACHVVI